MRRASAIGRRPISRDAGLRLGPTISGITYARESLVFTDAVDRDYVRMAERATASARGEIAGGIGGSTAARTQPSRRRALSRYRRMASRRANPPRPSRRTHFVGVADARLSRDCRSSSLVKEGIATGEATGLSGWGLPGRLTRVPATQFEGGLMSKSRRCSTPWDRESATTLKVLAQSTR